MKYIGIGIGFAGIGIGMGISGCEGKQMALLGLFAAVAYVGTAFFSSDV